MQVGLSDCRSFGSNQHQSGRSAKVSIGITIEKSPRSHTVVSGARKENAPALHSPEEHSSCKGRVVDVKSRPHGAVNLETTKAVLKEQKTLDCEPSRSSSRKTSYTNADKLYVNDVSVSTHKKADGLAYKHNRLEEGDTYVQQGLTFATVQKPSLLDHEVRRELPGEVDKKINNGLKMKLWEILGGVPSQKEQNMNSPKVDEDKENIKVDHNRGLREDRVPRAKHYSDPIETDSDSPNQTVRRPATRSMTRKRTPNKIARSLDDALNSGKKPISSTCSDYNHKAEENLGVHDNEKNLFLFGREENRRMLNQKAYEKSEAHIEFEKISRSTSDNNPCSRTNFQCNNKKDIFSFAEVAGNKKTSEKNVKAQSKRYNKKKNTAIDMKTINLPSGSSSKSAMQKDKNKRFFPAPTTVNLPSGSSSKSIPQNVKKEKVFISPAKGIQRIETSPCVPHPIKKQSTQPKNDPNNSKSTQMHRQGLSNIPLVPKVLVYETVRSSLLEKEKPSWAYLNSSPMPKVTVQHDKAACSPVTSKEDASDDLKSPTFAGNATPSTPSKPSNEIAGSPLRRDINFTWKFHNSDIMDNDKPGSCRSEAKTESSDDTRSIYESHSTFEVGNETKERLSLSPITGHDSDSFGAKELKNTGSIHFCNAI
ncbi:hypothetical protein KSP39_PZI002980 [Platanthera zijinensis]|uniref:Meiosis-specific protein ASY3-like coiled-coil domain-containing protein n=1 Tax=Platanthera zijinensis TaxID=2320716 RepID=A0AAP0GCF2_9ASPA